MHKQRIAFFAGLASKLKGQTGFGGHSNLAGRLDVLGCQFGVSFCYGFGLCKEYVDALPGDVFDAALLYHA
jgi:hypothetical protein